MSTFPPLLVNPLRNWSYKKIKMYRKCPFSVRLKYIERIPEPDPDPKYDVKRKRGILVHEKLAEAINLGGPIPPEAAGFTDVVEGLRAAGAVAEREEFFDRQWKPANGWDDGWVQIIKDVCVRTPAYALVGDWKTGRKHGNEIDHFEQMKLYGVSEWIINPGLPEYVSELYYLDQDEVWSHTFKPHQMEKYLGDFERDVIAMMTDLVFRPKPSKFNCIYCPYGPQRGNGRCPVGV